MEAGTVVTFGIEGVLGRNILYLDLAYVYMDMSIFDKICI